MLKTRPFSVNFVQKNCGVLLLLENRGYMCTARITLRAGLKRVCKRVWHGQFFLAITNGSTSLTWLVICKPEIASKKPLNPLQLGKRNFSAPRHTLRACVQSGGVRGWGALRVNKKGWCVLPGVMGFSRVKASRHSHTQYLSREKKKQYSKK